MTYTSLQFYGFLPIVITLYFVFPYRYRWIVLLISSYYFYLTCLVLNFLYIFLLIFVTLISYFAAISISRFENKNKRKIILVTGVLIFTAILFVFKYLNFFDENINSIFGLLNLGINFPAIKMAMPIGISFYTFQILCYIIDVYNDKIPPEKNFGIYATSIAFFPKLISGPIERGANIFPQFYKKSDIEYVRIIEGIKLIIFGLFKKVVIADNLSAAVNLVYDNPQNHYGLTIIFTTILLSFQIYCDFSGYTDIAIGIAKIFGFRLSENFNRPYLSNSIAEFWRRWHMTLSFWLRDYIFLPLAYSITRRTINLKTKIRPEVISYISAIIITMFICGVWHGPKWTFILWGVIHGVYLSSGFLLKKPRKKFYSKIKINKIFLKYSGIVSCFLLISFSWLFFRTNSLSDSLILLNNLVKIKISTDFLSVFKNIYDFYISIASICILILIEIIQTYREKKNEDFSIPKILNIGIILLMLIVIFIFGKFEQSDFLYFKF